MNSSASPKTVGWMSVPSQGRGTLQLLGSCFLTIFLCTWSAIHLNIPADDHTTTQIMLRKLKWVFIGIICPPYVALAAFTERWDVGFLLAEIQTTYDDKLCEPFSMTQAYYAVMGGYALKPKGSKDTIRLDGFQYYSLLKNGEIEVSSAILPNNEIKDRSKGDWITKTITCCQICWFVIQLLGRVAQDLPITTLEIFTLGLVFCGIITYSLWWNKPVDIRIPTVIPTTMDEEQIKDILWHHIHHPRDNSVGIDLHSVRFRRWGVNDLDWRYLVTTVSLVLAYEAIHFLAWNSHFPTAVEKYLWRSAVIGSALLPIINIPIHYTRPMNRWDQSPAWRSKYNVHVFVYFLCRLFVLVEIFVGLREAPVGVYQDIAWDLYIPHL